MIFYREKTVFAVRTVRKTMRNVIYGHDKINQFQISLNFMDGNEAYQMFKLIIEKIKRKSQKKKMKSDSLSESSCPEEYQKPSDKEITTESEYSEADEEAIRVQLWRDAQVKFSKLMLGFL